MAKLIYRYGVMGSSKSASALMLYHNFTERGKTVYLVKPQCDTRDGRMVKSSCGLEYEAMTIGDVLYEIRHQGNMVDLIIVDEAQFLNPNTCEILSGLVDRDNINVVCYGLRTDFKGELFEGSKYLLAHADKIEELKTICNCGNKCTHNLRINADGEAIIEGKQIELGYEGSTYKSVCRKCFNEAKEKAIYNKIKGELSGN